MVRKYAVAHPETHASLSLSPLCSLLDLRLNTWHRYVWFQTVCSCCWPVIHDAARAPRSPSLDRKSERERERPFAEEETGKAEKEGRADGWEGKWNIFSGCERPF